MAPFPLDRLHEHPYVKTSPDTHAHFRPTRLHYHAYAAAGLPFRWMMKPAVFGDEARGERGLVESFPLEGVDPAFEDKLGLKFKTHWVQDHRNHRALLDCFWNHVQPEESLVFLYAKQVPLVEDTGRRALIGAGRVITLGPLTEYDYEGSPQGKIRSMLWERMVIHSIRPGFKDGFLMPYQEGFRKLRGRAGLRPRRGGGLCARRPLHRVLLRHRACRARRRHRRAAGVPRGAPPLGRALRCNATAPQEAWIDRQLGRLWKKRGPVSRTGRRARRHRRAAGPLRRAGPGRQGRRGRQPVDSLAEPPWLTRASTCPPISRGSLDRTIAKAWQRMQPPNAARCWSC
jgi:hypothetical protein